LPAARYLHCAEAMPRPELRRYRAISLLAVAIGALLSVRPGHEAVCSADTREESECEEAVARLKECCPALAAHSITCKHTKPTSGCGSSCASFPDINRDESRCIRSRSCSEIVAQDVCGRVQSQNRYLCDDGNGEYQSLGTRVCP
jgi:hypothetical protein